MAIPAALLPTTCDIYRPFGDSTPLATAVPCRLVADMPGGRNNGLAGTLLFTHYIELDPSAGILDGCTRLLTANAPSYADGDEVRIPSGSSKSFVVVWVEERQVGTAQASKRAYLLRHAVS